MAANVTLSTSRTPLASTPEPAQRERVLQEQQQQVRHIWQSVGFRAMGQGTEAVMQMGFEALANGVYPLALAIYTQVIESDLSDDNIAAEAHLRRGTALERLDRLAEAIQDFDEIEELDPSDDNILAEAHLRRGAALERRGRSFEAIEDFNCVEEIDPENESILIHALLRRGSIHAAQGYWAEALHDYTEALEINSGDLVLAAKLHAKIEKAERMLSQLPVSGGEAGTR